MNLAFPQAIRVIMDRAIGEGNVGDIDRAAYFMFVIFSVQAVAQGLRYFLFTVAGERVVTSVRTSCWQAVSASLAPPCATHVH